VLGVDPGHLLGAHVGPSRLFTVDQQNVLHGRDPPARGCSNAGTLSTPGGGRNRQEGIGDRGSGIGEAAIPTPNPQHLTPTPQPPRRPHPRTCPPPPPPHRA